MKLFLKTNNRAPEPNGPEKNPSPDFVLPIHKLPIRILFSMSMLSGAVPRYVVSLHSAFASAPQQAQPFRFDWVKTSRYGA